MKRFPFAAVLGFLCLSSGLGIVGCGPKSTQDLIPDLPEGDRVYEMDSIYKPMPWAVGQWILYRKKEGGVEDLLKYSIVGKEGDAYWLEMSSINRYGQHVIQQLVSLLNPAGPSYVRVRRIRALDGKGRIAAMSVPVGSIWEDPIPMPTHRVNLGGAQDVRVPVGTFRGAIKASGEIGFLTRTSEGSAWYHSKVPISGMVKSVSKDRESVVEPVGFGLREAKPSF